MNILKHYRKLLFFLFNRYRGDNYGLMREYFARVLIEEVEEFASLGGKRVLDVGGAAGRFCRVLNEERDCVSINVDPDPKSEVWSNRGEVWPNTCVGRGRALPFSDGTFDLVVCRGVLEHVPTEHQYGTVGELYRVTKNGGLCYIMIPPWYSPWGGHHWFRPFHVLPFRWARFLKGLFVKETRKCESYADVDLYPIGFGRMLDMFGSAKFRVVRSIDTYFRFDFLTKIPVVREFCVFAASFILVKDKRGFLDWIFE